MTAAVPSGEAHGNDAPLSRRPDALAPAFVRRFPMLTRVARDPGVLSFQPWLSSLAESSRCCRGSRPRPRSSSGARGGRAQTSRREAAGAASVADRGASDPRARSRPGRERAGRARPAVSRRPREYLRPRRYERPGLPGGATLGGRLVGSRAHGDRRSASSGVHRQAQRHDRRTPRGPARRPTRGLRRLRHPAGAHSARGAGARGRDAARRRGRVRARGDRIPTADRRRRRLRLAARRESTIPWPRWR
jgi:hypothetical protein